MRREARVVLVGFELRLEVEDEHGWLRRQLLHARHWLDDVEHGRCQLLFLWPELLVFSCRTLSSVPRSPGAGEAELV